MAGWAAVASGLTTQSQWQNWFRDPGPVERDFVADAPDVPPALRRRLGVLGRAAWVVAAAVRPAMPCPLVFLSRHGELRQTAGLLAQLAAEGAVSPMGFSLSVHNAIPGIYSIAHQDRVATTCIAANRDLAEAGVMEGLGWLASGAARVMIVCAEDAVPEPYEGDGSETTFRYAWACLLAAADTGGISLEVHAAQAPTAVGPPVLPSLRALAFLAGEAPQASPILDTGRYRWRRHA